MKSKDAPITPEEFMELLDSLTLYPTEQNADAIRQAYARLYIEMLDLGHVLKEREEELDRIMEEEHEKLYYKFNEIIDDGSYAGDFSRSRSRKDQQIYDLAEKVDSLKQELKKHENCIPLMTSVKGK